MNTNLRTSKKTKTEEKPKNTQKNEKNSLHPRTRRAVRRPLSAPPISSFAYVGPTCFFSDSLCGTSLCGTHLIVKISKSALCLLLPTEREKQRG